MTESHQSPEVATLKEVQRLLASTEFASIHDLAARSGVEKLSAVTDDDHGSVKAIIPSSSTTSALPRRRSA